MNPDAPPLREILVADDHPIVAEAVATLIGRRFPDARVRVAVDFASATAAVADLAPGLVLIDADMPDAPPCDGVASVIKAAPATRLIVISGIRDNELVERLFAAGAAGFLPKMVPPAVMLAAVDLVLAGGRYQPTPVEARVPKVSRGAASLPALTGRLDDVARLLGDGMTNKEIARALGISPETAKTYVSQLLSVLGATNRTQAAMKARAEPPFRGDEQQY